ncbi:MAG: DNA polymerase III subunit gamma/tau, partial [Candidatus Eremiobacteraeota bacterium]|nr:DNA polymerase III subunit gamma/tau [Candidatus Eremiobacteraeota bacterium]
MSLYRTWRPKSFADLVGQDAVVRTLTHAIDTGKLAHAYLFSGPRGSGKTSAAKILARCIDCVEGPTAHPDNTCENCVAMLNGTALDVLEIDAASNRGIDEIRALRDAVKFAPSSMRMKVYIIDEAHMLTKEGANAFLKTLEEPPAHAVFILATTEPEKLPVTILSRCQRYAFRRISIPVMIERMREIATYEGIDIDDDALATIAYRADGGLRDALTMLEQAAAFAEGKVTAATIDLAFGATGRGYANELVDAVLARDASSVLRIIEEASDGGTDMQVLIRSLIAMFRNLLVARVDAELLQRDLAPEDAQRATERAQGVAQATIVRALRVLSDAASLARTGGNPRLELETALLRFVLSSEDPTLEAISSRVAALEEGGLGSGAPVGRPALVEKAPAAPKAAPDEVPAAKAAAPDSARAANAAARDSARAANAAARDSVILSAAPPGAELKDRPKTRAGKSEPVPRPTPQAPPEIPNPDPEPEPQPAPRATAKSNGPVTVQKVRAAWTNIRGKAEHERASLRAPLSGAMVDSI